MSYFKSENVPVPKVEVNEIPKGMTFTARFIVAGPVGYKEGVYLLPQENLDSFAYTLKGCPVTLGHTDIEDVKDMKEKAVGYVSRVERAENGDWFADFVVFCPKALKKIEDGEAPYVSCAYRADLTDHEVELNNVKYKKKIIGGEMLHLALVKNPRYNGTEIWKNSNEDYMVSEGAIYNEKETSMKFWKKSAVEIDKDVMINTKSGDKTIDELVNELEAANEKIAEQAKKIEELEAAAAEKSAEETTAVETQAEETSATEETQVEAPAEVATDAELKKDLNNSLTEDVKVTVIPVPNVK